MFSIVMDTLRLVRAGWVLGRNDAIVPREFAHLTPPPLRLLGATLRLGARNGDKRPGERMAAAFEKLGPAYVKLGQFMACLLYTSDAADE